MPDPPHQCLRTILNLGTRRRQIERQIVQIQLDGRGTRQLQQSGGVRFWF